MTDNIKTDMDLINACLGGCSFSFEELIDRYKNFVYSIILRQTRDREEANDIAQDVFLKLYRNLDKYTPEYKFSTWVMKITGNHIIDLHRKKRLEVVSYEAYLESGNDLVSNDSPEGEYLTQENSDRINKILEELPEMYRTPVILYHKHDKSYAEISEEIGQPLSKVKNRIFRGRRILKELLAAEGK